jgi:predicted metal-dependent hydrolase
MNSSHLVVDDLRIGVQRSAHRRTMQITVERTGQLVISAPPEVDESVLLEFIRDKRFWIYTKLAERDQLHRSVPKKSFVDGEGFLYLGRTHRLRVVPDQDVALKLSNGRFLLRHDSVPLGREQLVAWYVEKARHWLTSRVLERANAMGVRPAGVRVQDLGYRWGSCGKGDCLYFHWKTILLPARIALYVVVHEMAHLHEPHHTPQFWLRVEREMPDFAQRKAWLAGHGMDVEGI